MLPAMDHHLMAPARGFERIARDAAARFRGRHLRVHRQRTIHAVGWYRWVGNLQLPGPACRTGWAGVSALDDLRAVHIWQPITCRKCLRTEEAQHAQRFVPHPAEQLSLLDLDPEPQPPLLPLR